MALEHCVIAHHGGDGSPQPFYLRYGFKKTGEVKWGEDLLRLELTPTGGRD